MSATGMAWARRTAAVLFVGAASGLIGGAAPVTTAANTVIAGRMAAISRSVSPNDMKPSQCAGITVTAKHAGAGVFSVPTSAGTLTLGSAGNDVITGGPGDDCIIGGGGSDTLDGGGGYDICITSTDVGSLTCEERHTVAS